MSTIPTLSEVSQVPAFPGWNYGPQGITKDSESDGEWIPVRQLNWCPIVTRHLIVANEAGEILDRLITVTVAGTTATITPKDLRDARCWDRFPKAVGTHKRGIRDVLAHVIEDQAAKLPTVSALPRWHDGQMEVPPEDVIVKGYTRTYGDEDQARIAWQRIGQIAARNPRLALVMGTAAGGPYLPGPFKQSFWVHMNGAGRQGKTTAQRIAAAMYGDPQMIVKPWNVSTVGLMNHLGKLGFLPAFLDEIAAARFTSKSLESTVFSSVQGATRLIGTRTIGETRETPTWYGVLFSTGNESILGQIANEAIAARVIEVPTPIVSDAATAEDLDVLGQVGPGWPFRWLRESGMRPDTLSVQQHFPLPAGGVARSIAERLTVALAGAAALEHLLPAPGLYAAALESAQDILARMVAELAERGVRPSQRLLEAVEQALASRPGAFPSRTAEVGDYATISGFDLTEDSITGDVAVLTTALGAIAEAAGIVDPTTALRELKTAPQDGPRLVAQESAGYRTRLRVGKWRPQTYVFVLGDVHDQTKNGGDSGDNGDNQATAQHMQVFDQAEHAPATPPGDRDSVPAARGQAGTEAGTGGDTPPTAAPKPSYELVKGEEKPCVSCGFPSVYRYHGRPYDGGCAPGDLDAVRVSEAGTVDAPDRIAPDMRSPAPASTVPAARGQQAGTRGQTGTTAGTDIKPEDFANFAKAVRLRYPEATDKDLRNGLRRFMAVMDGLEFDGSPAVVGTLLFHRIMGKNKARVPELERVDITPPKDLVNAWNGVLSTVDLTPGWIVSADVNNQYLAAAGSLDLGTGLPVTMTGREALAPSVINSAPGYVRLLEPVRLVPWAAPVAAGAWITTPMAKFALQRKLIRAELVDEALIWPERRRWLSTWVKAVGTAIGRLRGNQEPSALYATAALKATYAAFLGGHMRSEKYNRTAVRRPDWQDMIVGAAWANMLRHLEHTKPAPFCVVKDTAYFVSDGPNVPIPGLTYHHQPGKWKPARQAPINPAITRAVERGLAYKVRDEVAKVYNETARKNSVA